MYTTVICTMSLGLIQAFTGQFLLSASSQPIAAVAGDDVILPCHLDPPADATDMTILWSRPDLVPDIVFFYREGQESYDSQNPSYEGRTALMYKGLKKGDISLKLSRVQLSDQGNYTCYIPKLHKEHKVQLIVGAVSLPVVRLQGINEASRGIVLGCESAGWYPEPVLSWLDGVGNLLPAESTQITTGPDGLYRVTSTVTVNQTHTNTFTCRVHLKWINQSRETHLHIPEAIYPPDQSRCSEPGGCSVALIVVNILLALCVTLSIGLYIRGVKKTSRPNDQSCYNCSPQMEECQPLRWGSRTWLRSCLAEPQSDMVESGETMVATSPTVSKSRTGSHTPSEQDVLTSAS